MVMKSILVFASSGVLLAGGFAFQHPPEAASSPLRSRSLSTTAAAEQSEPVASGQYGAISTWGSKPAIVYGHRVSEFSEQRELDREIEDAAKALRQAEDRTEREDAKESLVELLSKDYDDRLAGYQASIDELEEKLSEMKDKLERRRRAKNEMIDLRIQVLEAEAEDLGWPARVNSGRLPQFPARVEFGLPVAPRLAPPAASPAEPK